MSCHSIRGIAITKIIKHWFRTVGASLRLRPNAAHRRAPVYCSSFCQRGVYSISSSRNAARDRACKNESSDFVVDHFVCSCVDVLFDELFNFSSLIVFTL